jgi:hypothetical protein
LQRDTAPNRTDVPTDDPEKQGKADSGIDCRDHAKDDSRIRLRESLAAGHSSTNERILDG